MRQLLLRVMAVLVMAPSLAAFGQSHDEAGALRSTETLLANLRRSGRADAGLVQITDDPTGGAAFTARGQLALEPPDRLRLDFPDSGEQLTVRGDGGEWLQPAAQQMLVLTAAQAQAGARLWDLLLAGGRRGFVEHPRGQRVYLLLPRDRGASALDSARVLLGSTGLPSRVDLYTAGGDHMRYHFRGWRFTRPSGPGAFTLRAPPGYAVVPMP